MTLDAAQRYDAVPSGSIGNIRVAIVSDAAPERNGVGAYYSDLLDYLAPRLENVQVFSPRIVNGVWTAGMVLPLPGDATQKLCFPNPYTMRRDLKALRPDVVIVPTPGVYGMWGAYLAGRWGVPILTGFHTSFEHLTDLYWQGSMKGRFYRQYLEKSHQYLFGRSSRVLVNSEEMEALARRMGAECVKLIGTPLPAAFTRHPLVPYGGELERVLFAGRLAAEKNIETVIDAAAYHPDIAFSIAGDGPLRSVVEDAARKLPNVTYLGWLDRDALRDEVDRHHALVLPSHFESFGTIALEAMSRRRVVIVSPGTGISDWSELAPGFVRMTSDESLANTFAKVRNMGPDRRSELAQRAHDVAHAFNDRNVEGWEMLLAEVVQA
jgi:glycosyltransferase involved in cell wall biosynthesis